MRLSCVQKQFSVNTSALWLQYVGATDRILLSSGTGCARKRSCYYVIYYIILKMSEGTEENHGNPYHNRCCSWALKHVSPQYNVPAEIWSRYLHNTMSRLKYETDTTTIQCPGWKMKQIPPQYNVPAEIWNRYHHNTMSRLKNEADTSTIQCPGWNMKQIPPQYNVPAEKWSRYLHNTMSRLKYEADTSTIQCPGWNMKQIAPQYNFPAEIWNRYRNVTCWANMQ